MPRKRKDSFEESIEECVKEIKTTVEEVDNTAGSRADPQEEIERKREELIKLSENGQIETNVKTIKKASNKIIERYYNEYERKRMQKANEFPTDQLISKFSDALGGLDAIESPEGLEDELKKMTYSREMSKELLKCLVLISHIWEYYLEVLLLQNMFIIIKINQNQNNQMIEMIQIIKLQIIYHGKF